MEFCLPALLFLATPVRPVRETTKALSSPTFSIAPSSAADVGARPARMSSAFSTCGAHFNENSRVLPSLLAFFAATFASLSSVVPRRSLRYSSEETMVPRSSARGSAPPSAPASLAPRTLQWLLRGR